MTLTYEGACYCRKVAYVSRIEARHYLRTGLATRKAGLHVYQCPDNPTLWHTGHLAYKKLAKARGQ